MAKYHFMLKTSFRGRFLSAVMEQISFEKKKAWSGTGSATNAVVVASYNPFFDVCCEFLKKKCEDFFRQTRWKSDPVVGLASLDYAVLFELPKG